MLGEVTFGESEVGLHVVLAVVNSRPLHHEEEAVFVVVLQQLQSFHTHVEQTGLRFRLVSFLLEVHVAVGEQTQHWKRTSRFQPHQLLLVVHNFASQLLPRFAKVNRIFSVRFELCKHRFCVLRHEVLQTPAENDVYEFVTFSQLSCNV